MRNQGRFTCQPIEDRFWSKVNRVGDDDCWLWIGNINVQGYGVIRKDVGTITAHRLSYLLANDDLPTGKVVRHRCDTPACVNPKHLEIGTQADNVRDMVARKRTRRSRLSQEQIRAIQSDTRPNPKISAEYGVDTSTICRIKNRKGPAYD